MSLVLRFLAVLVGLLGAMLLAIELGRRIGRARLAREGEGAFAGLGAMEGAVFGLMGLLLAFAFSRAAGRSDDRRALIVEEANDVGTAWLRIDLLPDSIQPVVRARFLAYLDMRLAAYQSFPNLALVEHRLDSAEAMQRGIWDLAVAGVRRSPLPSAGQLVLPSLNALFDIATTRRAALRMHTPNVVFVMLALLTLACSVLAGAAIAANPSHSWVHMSAFSLLLVAAFYLIIGLEFPRLGLIRVDLLDQVLVEVRASLEPPR